VEGYAAGLWSSAERAQAGDYNDVATMEEVVEVIDMMAEYHITPSSLGLTVSKMRGLIVSTARRETGQLMRDLRNELAGPQRVCGDLSLAVSPTVMRVGQWMLRYNLTASHLGMTRRMYSRIYDLAGDGCEVASKYRR
jgi:hypothetical protein